MKEESLPNISDQIKDVIGGKDETSIFRKIFLSLLILLIIISILGIIGAFVPSIGHYFTSLCEVFGKLFDSFGSLFGLKPPTGTNNRDIRMVFTVLILGISLRVLVEKCKYKS